MRAYDFSRRTTAQPFCGLKPGLVAGVVSVGRTGSAVRGTCLHYTALEKNYVNHKIERLTLEEHAQRLVAAGAGV
jgi:hypothetical protein